MADALKLIFASQFLGKGTRKILALADSAAAIHLRGKSWMAQALKANQIELEFVDLPRQMIDSIRVAAAAVSLSIDPSASRWILWKRGEQLAEILSSVLTGRDTQISKAGLSSEGWKGG